MGRIKDSNAFGFSGRIGNVVSCYRHGGYYLRTLPDKVRQPDTDRQLAQRMRFALVQQFLQPVKAFIRTGFAAEAQRRSAYSAAMSVNLMQAIAGEWPDLYIDPAKVLLSRGTLPGADGLTLTPHNHRAVFAWNNTTPGTNPADRATLILVAPALRQSAMARNAALRRHGQAILDIPAGWEGTQVSGYLTFTDQRLIAHPDKPAWISCSGFAGIITAGE